MKCEQFSYASSDGKNKITAYWFLPEEREPVGLVQIVHGMNEYALRYRETAERLAGEGYVVVAEDHLGHGQTAAVPEDLGFFAEQDGVGYVLDDLHALTLLVKQKYPDLPFILLGHSMGSFLVRLYATRFAFELDGLIIMGTGGPNPLLPVGRALAKIIRLFKGPRHRSGFLAKLAFSGYLSHYEKGCPENAWLSRDTATLDAYREDPLTRFIFTVSAYQDLFSMVRECNRREWFETYPKQLRTLVISGAEDPVGAWGQGPTYVAETLKKAGVSHVDLYLYEGARHELIHETNREEVFADLIKWIKGTEA